MKKYSKQEVGNIPMIFKCGVYQKWIDESGLPQNYLGKLAVLVKTGFAKSKWTFEGVDFEIME